MKRRKQAIVVTVAAFFVIAFVFEAFFYFEPFAIRHEGKTVNQWLNFYLKAGDQPQRNVIDAFGTNAFKPLIKAQRLPLFCRFCGKLERRFNIRLNFEARRNASRNAYLAESWGNALVKQNAAIEDDLLRNNRDDEFVVMVFHLTRDHTPYRRNRLTTYIWYPDEIISKRARDLLKRTDDLRKDVEFDQTRPLRKEQVEALKQRIPSN